MWRLLCWLRLHKWRYFRHPRWLHICRRCSRCSLEQQLQGENPLAEAGGEGEGYWVTTKRGE